jgi:hypothetical protein
MINKELEKTFSKIDFAYNDSLNNFINEISILIDDCLFDTEMTTDLMIDKLNTIIIKKEGTSINPFFEIINKHNDYDSRYVVEECQRLYGIDEDTINKVVTEINHELKRGIDV